jgi:glycogen operon protein
MLLAGDEFGQTQRGNNNAYCQDSPVAWLNWDLAPEQRELLAFTRELLRMRATQPVFRRRHFFQGREIHGADVKDLYWLKPDGGEMTDADWHAGEASCLGMVLPGDQIAETGEQGERITGGTFAILFNAHDFPVQFCLGTRRRDVRWECVLDTARPGGTTHEFFEQMSLFPLQARSVAVLRGDRSSPL